jgi:hypothetical protein
LAPGGPEFTYCGQQRHISITGCFVLVPGESLVGVLRSANSGGAGTVSCEARGPMGVGAGIANAAGASRAAVVAARM